MRTCIFCNSDSSKLIYNLPVENVQKGHYSTDVFHIVRCSKCGLVYVDPMPTDEDLKKYYSESEESLKFMQENFINTGRMQKKGWTKTLKVIEYYSPNKGRILDIGCGPGWFLDTARERTWDTYGVDMSSFFSKFAQEKLGLNVFCGRFEEANFKENFFDVITMFDFIEHVKKPLDLLRNVRHILKDDGLLVITTADIDSLCAKIYGINWRQIIPIGHIYYFSRKSMRNILEKAGFKILKITGVRYDETTRFRTFLAFVRELLKFIVRRIIQIMIYPFINLLIKKYPNLKDKEWKILGREMSYKNLRFKVGDQAVLGDVMKIYARKI